MSAGNDQDAQIAAWSYEYEPPKRGGLMGWYWNMSDRAAAWFFVGQFAAIYGVVYLVLGLTVWGWTFVPIFFVPAWAGIFANLAWSTYNVSQM